MVCTLNKTALTNIVLKSSYRNCDGSSVNYCHMNAGSAVPHIDELNAIFNGTDLHFLCVSETWFKRKHTNKMMAINGFKLVRSDRNDGTWRWSRFVCEIRDCF
jgi:archaellum component FlaF (FlaF/FlaG flagellin family)